MRSPTPWAPPQTPFTLAHVRPLGVTPRMLRTALAAGRITRLAPGVYVSSAAVSDDPMDRHLQFALAHQILQPDLVASHETAALAWGLALEDTTDAIEGPPRFISTKPGARSRPTAHAIVAVRDLPTHHRCQHPSGLRVATPARAAVDVAAGLRLPEALVTLDSAARTHLIDLVGQRRLRDAYTDDRQLQAAAAPLHEAARRASTQFTRRHLADVVAQADPRRESPLESLSDGHFLLAGLPRPLLQPRIDSPIGPLYPDFLWAEQMVVGEADGLMKYRRPEDLAAEKRRQEVLEQMGYLVVRWLADEIRRAPHSVVARVQAAIERRSG